MSLTDPLLAAALAYAPRGWHVFPLQPRDKRPHPGTHGFLDASSDPDRIRAIWRPGSNVGIATGASGLLVVDIDGEEGEASVAELPPLEPTREQRTGGGGRQLFYQRPTWVELGNTAGKLGAKIDTRGVGGYVVVPPSIHPSGRRYEWANTARVVTPPEWLVARLAPPVPLPSPTIPSQHGSAYALAALEGELTRLAQCVDGEGNDTLNRVAFRVGQLVAEGLVAEGLAVDAMRSIAASIRLRGIEATIRSGLRAGKLKANAGRLP